MVVIVIEADHDFGGWPVECDEKGKERPAKWDRVFLTYGDGDLIENKEIPTQTLIRDIIKECAITNGKIEYQNEFQRKGPNKSQEIESNCFTTVIYELYASKVVSDDREEKQGHARIKILYLGQSEQRGLEIYENRKKELFREAITV